MIEAAYTKHRIEMQVIGKRDPELLALARSLEATFLAEMLKNAGLGEARDAFGGGAGEDHFASLLVQHQAEVLSSSQSIGLAEAIYRSLSSADQS